jgi:hypothetical protein
MIASVAFLFDSSHPDAPTSYGARFDAAFLKALKLADAGSATTSWVLRGDMLTHHLAMKVSSVSQHSHTISYDYDLLKMAIHDLWTWLSAPPSQFHSEHLLERMLRLSVFHCVALPTIELAVACKIHPMLTADPLYMGMAVVDPNNPILNTLLLDYLLRDAGISAGQVWLERSFEGYVNTPFEGGEHFSSNGLKIVEEGGLADKFGAVPSYVPSRQGDAIAARYAKKGRLALQQRVLSLAAKAWGLESGGSFTFDALPTVAVIESSIPPEKLTHYALDPDRSPETAGKAKFFREVLAITKDDWRYLVTQVHEAIDDATITDLVMKRWDSGKGLSFNAVLAIRGRNGRIANVFTNWIMRQGEKPQLVTIRPEGNEIAENEAIDPPIVSTRLAGNDRWQRLYELADEAGCKARDDAVPTPMFILGFGGIDEGECGYAYVHVPDARRNFARWLIRSGKAYRGYNGGATKMAPRITQSVDRAYAYAKAFARVLEYNGIDCTIEQQLD